MSVRSRLALFESSRSARPTLPIAPGSFMRGPRTGHPSKQACGPRQFLAGARRASSDRGRRAPLPRAARHLPAGPPFAISEARERLLSQFAKTLRSTGKLPVQVATISDATRLVPPSEPRDSRASSMPQYWKARAIRHLGAGLPFALSLFRHERRAGQHSDGHLSRALHACGVRLFDGDVHLAHR
jgi:hypothetical protein